MKKKILLVDDKAEFRMLLSIFLAEKYEVHTAGNGLEALAALQNGLDPDMIVTDIMMPEMDGKSLIMQVKTSGAFNHIPVLVLSTIDRSEERIQLLKGGADDFLVKPFNPEELAIRIESRLRKSA
jgi:DNA-binding response OmpR family regulator